MLCPYFLFRSRLVDINEMHGTQVEIKQVREWVREQSSRAENVPGQVLGREWITALTESLCQKRRELAPIDEPSEAWVLELKSHFQRICST